MGHRSGSNLAFSTYQTVDRPVDLAGLAAGEEQHGSISAARSSVVWDRTVNHEEVDDGREIAMSDPTLIHLIKELREKEQLVKAEFGVASNEVPASVRYFLLTSLPPDLVSRPSRIHSFRPPRTHGVTCSLITPTSAQR